MRKMAHNFGEFWQKSAYFCLLLYHFAQFSIERTKVPAKNRKMTIKTPQKCPPPKQQQQQQQQQHPKRPKNGPNGAQKDLKMLL